MVLIDTSVWIEHVRQADPRLTAALHEGGVLIHPLVIEELACGNLQNRKELLDLLAGLPTAPQGSHQEFLDFVTRHRLEGTGLGVVDIHLLISARLANAALFTHDKALQAAAHRLHAS